MGCIGRLYQMGPQFVAKFTWELGQYLCIFINERQDDWTDLFPLAEFQYNNHVHSSTQHLLFLLEAGHLPQMGFEPDQRPSQVESVNEFIDQMKAP